MHTSRKDALKTKTSAVSADINVQMSLGFFFFFFYSLLYNLKSNVREVNLEGSEFVLLLGTAGI